MATISTNRLSLVEYSPKEAGYIRSLASLSGICVNKIDAEDAFEVTLDSMSSDSYLSYFQNFTNGFTLFVRLPGNENMVVSPDKKYDLRLKGSDEPKFTSVGTVFIAKETRFLSNDVLIMHQIEDGRFIICNRDLELPYLSSSAHASNSAYTVLGIGETTHSRKFLRSDGTWQKPTNTTYATLATNAHASGTNYVVNGPGDSTNTFLRGDGSWQTLSDTTYATLATNAHASGTSYLVNGIGSTTNAKEFLRNDGTWQIPIDTTYATLATNAHATNTSYVVNGSGYSGTGDGTKFLREDGTWQAPTNTTYKQLNTSNYSTAEGHVIKGPGTAHSDYAALLPTGTWGDLYPLFGTDSIDINKRYVIHGLNDSQTPTDPDELRQYYLCADGRWEIPAGTTYTTLSASAHASNVNYVINGIGSSTNSSSYLRSDGSWHTPANTTYGTFTTAANGLVPKPTAATATTNYVLAGNGTWVTMSGGGSVQQAWGLYGNAGTPVQGISMPTSQNQSRFPIVNTKYDGAAAVTSVLFPTNEKELIALPVEISKDGVIYVPVSSAFGKALKELGYELFNEE